MNTFIKSMALAAVMMSAAGLAPQFTHAKSTVQVPDCKDLNRSIPDCGPFSEPNSSSPSAEKGNLVLKLSTDQDNPPFGSQYQQSENQDGGWQFDPSRHHRQFHRNSFFQYPMGGYYYDQPYWQQVQQPIQVGRVNCAQGLSIVAASGFNSVQTTNCAGGTYTYQARRLKLNYEISVSAESGTILGTTFE